jgi:hypothetical protein
VLLSQVTIANHTQSRANLRWIEYWGCHVYQFSFRAFIEQSAAAAARWNCAESSAIVYALLSRAAWNAGLLEVQTVRRPRPKEEELFQAHEDESGDARQPVSCAYRRAGAGSFVRRSPSAGTFLVRWMRPRTGSPPTPRSFFGAGGAAAPSGLAGALDGSLAPAEQKEGCCWSAASRLTPGEQRTLYFLYGYGRADPGRWSRSTGRPSVWKDSSQQWKAKGLRFETKAEPWVKRETAWHYYYLRSSLTYDDFFGEHILSQGGIYQYSMGFQGAARDPLQHALPFLFSDPEIVKRFCATP